MLRTVLPVIREIQRSGASLHEIADALNARGIGTPRGGRWYAKSVSKRACALSVVDAPQHYFALAAPK
jgi:Recombinase